MNEKLEKGLKNWREEMVGDFGGRFCEKCDGEIVKEGDVITMYEGKNICRCDEGLIKGKCIKCKKEAYYQKDMKQVCGRCKINKLKEENERQK